MKFAKLAIPANHPAHLVLGLTIWSVWFVAIYGGLSVFCSFEESHVPNGGIHPINLGLLALTAITSMCLAVLAVWCWRNARGFPGRVSALLYLASLISTIGVALPTFFLPPCL